MGVGKSIASESACCWNAPVFGSLASGVWSGKPPSSAIQLTRMVSTAGMASCAGSPEVGERYFPLLGSWYPQPTWKRSRLGTPPCPLVTEGCPRAQGPGYSFQAKIKVSVKEHQGQTHWVAMVTLTGLFLFLATSLSLLFMEIVGIMPLSCSNPCTGFPVPSEKSPNPHVVQQALWTWPGVLSPHHWPIPLG